MDAQNCSSEGGGGGGGGGQTPCILINRRFLLTSVLVIEGLFA